VVTLIAWSACFTVSDFEPLLASVGGNRRERCADVRPGYDRLIPARLTPLSVATCPGPVRGSAADTACRWAYYTTQRGDADLPLTPLRLKLSVVRERGRPAECPVAGRRDRLVRLVPATSVEAYLTLKRGRRDRAVRLVRTPCT